MGRLFELIIGVLLSCLGGSNLIFTIPPNFTTQNPEHWQAIWFSLATLLLGFLTLADAIYNMVKH